MHDDKLGRFLGAAGHRQEGTHAETFYFCFANYLGRDVLVLPRNLLRRARKVGGRAYVGGHIAEIACKRQAIDDRLCVLRTEHAFRGVAAFLYRQTCFLDGGRARFLAALHRAEGVQCVSRRLDGVTRKVIGTRAGNILERQIIDHITGFTSLDLVDRGLGCLAKLRDAEFFLFSESDHEHTIGVHTGDRG